MTSLSYSMMDHRTLIKLKPSLNYGCRTPDNRNVSSTASTELENLEFVEDLFMLKMPPPPSPRMGKIPALEEKTAK
jgi:hypothetical protein